MAETKFIVVADDLTGSNDTGVQFSKKGFNVFVTSELDENLLEKELEVYDVLVINTESRFLSSQEAYRKLYNLGIFMKNRCSSRIYKKIDSTYRGNIASEIKGLKDSLGIDKVIIASGFPKVGRQIKEGRVYVHGELLENTGISKDPKNPITQSFIPDILNLEKYSIFNSESLTQLELTEDYVILDSSEDKDLEVISESLEEIEEPFILVGTGGLAEYLKVQLENKINILFSGSANETTHMQVNELISKENINSFLLDHKDLSLENELIYSKIKELLKESIDQNKDFVLSVLPEKTEMKNLEEMETASRKIMDFFKGISREIFKEYSGNIKNIFITGGDTAINILQANGIAGINITGEIESGIPYGRIFHQKKNFLLATKAGGFGNKESLVNVVNFFKDK